MNTLYVRLTMMLIGVASAVLLITSLIFIVEIHFHLLGLGGQSAMFQHHLELALIQSVAWAAVVGVVVAILISLVIAKRLSAPLIMMKTIANRMTQGKWSSRVQVKGPEELMALGKAMNELAQQLQKQQQLRKNMTADVAHELRTPLATLKSHMEAMIEGVWQASPARLQSCYEEIERLTVVVGDFEQLAEVESPSFQLKLQVARLDELLFQQVSIHQALFQKKGIELHVAPLMSVNARVDKVRFGQMISNLLNNAWKYTQEHGRVDVSLHTTEQMVTVIIRDTGSGIAAEHVSHVFERFYRADQARERQMSGSGIGLTIVDKLMKAHGGMIELTSEVGQGTCVTLHFPMDNVTDDH